MSVSGIFSSVSAWKMGFGCVLDNKVVKRW